MIYLSGNLSPQGTKLGPWLFLIMINDLVVKKARLWKYVDDTTISETVAKGELIISNAQGTKYTVVQRSKTESRASIWPGIATVHMLYKLREWRDEYFWNN